MLRCIYSISQVLKYKVEAFFSFHNVNGYEQPDGSLVLDVIANDMASGQVRCTCVECGVTHAQHMPSARRTCASIVCSAQVPVANFTLENMRNQTLRDAVGLKAKLHRYLLPPPSSTARHVNRSVLPVVGERGSYPLFDLPGINPTRHGRHYCYVWFWAPNAAGSDHFEATALVKKNVCAPESGVQKWQVADQAIRSCSAKMVD